ncbi:hypothetical protein CR513_14101, partial [Mucuna pruriens]
MKSSQQRPKSSQPDKFLSKTTLSPHADSVSRVKGVTTPILALPNFNKSFKLECVVSNNAIRAMLLQVKNYQLKYSTYEGALCSS